MFRLGKYQSKFVTYHVFLCLVTVFSLMSYNFLYTPDYQINKN